MATKDPSADKSGETERVLVADVDRHELHYHRERVAHIPMCGPNSESYSRYSVDDARELAEPCATCFGGGER